MCTFDRSNPMRITVRAKKANKKIRFCSETHIRVVKKVSITRSDH